MSFEALEAPFSSVEGLGCRNLSRCGRLSDPLVRGHDPKKLVDEIIAKLREKD